MWLKQNTFINDGRYLVEIRRYAGWFIHFREENDAYVFLQMKPVR